MIHGEALVQTREAPAIVAAPRLNEPPAARPNSWSGAQTLPNPWRTSALETLSRLSFLRSWLVGPSRA